MTRRNYIAIGDIHGMADMLQALLLKIDLDWHPKRTGVPLTLVFLGDYVDRGPDSAGVIDTIMGLQNNDVIDVVALKGNHEAMFKDAFIQKNRESMWIRNGGLETLSSYSLTPQDLDEKPQGKLRLHLNWIADLPSVYDVDDEDFIFVHAGVHPKLYPDDGPDYHLWTRSHTFFNPSRWDKNEALRGKIIVHGHTVRGDFNPQVTADGRRINIDTGACYGGQLTAAVFEGGSQRPQFIHV